MIVFLLFPKWKLGGNHAWFFTRPPSMRDIWSLTIAKADNEYLVYDEERWTYTQTHEEVASVANWLVSQGIKPGDKVAVAMRNYPEWVIAYWAILSIGAVCVGMNACGLVRKCNMQFDDSQPDIIISDAGCYRHIEPLRSSQILKLSVCVSKKKPKMLSPIRN